MWKILGLGRICRWRQQGVTWSRIKSMLVMHKVEICRPKKYLSIQYRDLTRTPSQFRSREGYDRVICSNLISRLIWTDDGDKGRERDAQRRETRRLNGHIHIQEKTNEPSPSLLLSRLGPRASSPLPQNLVHAGACEVRVNTPIQNHSLVRRGSRT